MRLVRQLDADHACHLRRPGAGRVDDAVGAHLAFGRRQLEAAAVTPDGEVDGPAEHALTVAPARRELLDPGGVPVAEADPDDLVTDGRQPRPRAVERDEERVRLQGALGQHWFVKGRVGIGYGVSQTGRFIRHYLYQGFNADERGRVAFDGFFVHTAGAGRGSFNHRFAQPSRDAQPYSTFFYPTDVFPFTSVPTRDPVSGQRSGLRDNLRGSSSTRIFYVDGGHEYWGRAASLTHTTPDGKRDVGFLPTERRYVISSAQHSSPSAWPLADSAKIVGTPAYRGDPLDQRLALRALMSALIDWVTLRKQPPASTYPTLADRNLVRPADLQFPRIPNLPVARIPNQPYRMDFGPRWGQGIIDREPPALGAPYPVFVSRVDSVGNELGGIRSIEILAPLATYYPWQLRTGMAAADRLVSFRGTFAPLPRTEAERRASGDSRASIEALYGDRTRFLRRVDAGISDLIAHRFLLPEDSIAARNRMTDMWNLFGLRAN